MKLASVKFQVYLLVHGEIFKTDIIKVGLDFSSSNFFITKSSLANKWMREKYLLAVIQLYLNEDGTISKIPSKIQSLLKDGIFNKANSKTSEICSMETLAYRIWTSEIKPSTITVLAALDHQPLSIHKIFLEVNYLV